jgi:elongation factor G
MKEYDTRQLRNVVLLGHGSVGKTSLAEVMLFASGAINRMGEVENGTTVADFDEEEMRRHISLNLAVVPVEWGGCKINVLDTPGYTDFVGEVESAVRVADLALVLVDAVAGVEVGTELVWDYADEHGLPRMVVVNKMNRENASLDRTEAALREAFGKNFFPVQLPIGAAGDFAGVVDLVAKNALMGSDGKEAEIPDNMADQVEEAYLQVIEAAAEADDELIVKYLEGEELTDKEIQQGLRAAILNGTAVPVLVTAATASLGVKALLDALVAYAPSPADRGSVTAEGAAGEEEIEPNELSPLAALAFKTTADPFVGKLTCLRVYGGILESDNRVYNSRVREEERLGQLYVMRGKEQLPVARLRTGDIGAVAKLSHRRHAVRQGPSCEPARPDLPITPLWCGGQPHQQGRSGQARPHTDAHLRGGSDAALAPGGQHQTDHPGGHGRGPRGHCAEADGEPVRRRR